jgi:hypothetical protein
MRSITVLTVLAALVKSVPGMGRTFYGGLTFQF